MNQIILDKLNIVGNNVALNKTEKSVVSLLIEDTEYTADELAAKIGVSKRIIERAFVSLQNKKVVERIASKSKKYMKIFYCIYF